MKRTALKIAVALLRVIYVPHKLFSTKHKILFLSRQRNKPTQETQLLLDTIRSIDPSIQIICITKMIPPSFVGKIVYCFHMAFTELHHIATSKVVLLDGYSIPISVLKHKPSLTVVQTWHALGILKKFGKLVANEDEGYDQSIIDIMHMHENYNYILCSSEFCKPFYAKAFGYTEDKIKVLPLPRTEMLKDSHHLKEKQSEILSLYPQLAEKETILYAPTLRKTRDSQSHIKNLMDTLKPEKYHLVVKLHPTEAVHYPQSILSCPEFTSMDLLAVADYVISDYSAFIFEAAQAGIPVYLYAYDLDLYKEERGFCVDYEQEMPVPPARTAEELIAQLEAALCTQEKLDALCAKFIVPRPHPTKDLAQFVLSLC